MQRWQARRLLDRHVDLPRHGLVWTRAVKCCVGGPSAAVKHAAHAGALRALWAGGIWTQARKAQRSLECSGVCALCSTEPEIYSYLIFKCGSLKASLDDEDRGNMPVDLAEIRDRIQEHGTISRGRADEDHAAMCLGLPFEPPTPQPPALDPPRLALG
eukprot:3170095-Pyramimonas_sp.AAC.1